jgi:hypothetical protein
MIIDVPQEQEFVFHDGRRAKNIMELKQIIEDMPEAEFRNFVNENKNDFANWVKYAVKDEPLAKKILSTKSKEIILMKLKERVNEKLAEDKLYEVAKKETMQHIHETIEKYEDTGTEKETMKEIKEEAKEKKAKDSLEPIMWTFVYGVILGLIIVLLLYIITMVK